LAPPRSGKPTDKKDGSDKLFCEEESELATKRKEEFSSIVAISIFEQSKKRKEKALCAGPEKGERVQGTETPPGQQGKEGKEFLLEHGGGERRGGRGG